MTVGDYHQPVPEVDQFGWYSTVCGIAPCSGPLERRRAITCIECLVKEAEHEGG